MNLLDVVKRLLDKNLYIIHEYNESATLSLKKIGRMAELRYHPNISYFVLFYNVTRDFWRPSPNRLYS